MRIATLVASTALLRKPQGWFDLNKINKHPEINIKTPMRFEK